MHSPPLSLRKATVLCSLVVLVMASSAHALGRHVFYGKPGKVQIVKAQGSKTNGQDPQLTIPVHKINRSPLAPKLAQKICTTFQVWTPAVAPATGWVLGSSSSPLCGGVGSRQLQKIGNWVSGAKIGVSYHLKFVVTWAAKKRKLAKASYDFNTIDDYQCVTTFCRIDQGTDKVPYFSFFG